MCTYENKKERAVHMSVIKTKDIEAFRKKLKKKHVLTSQEKEQIDNYLSELEIYRSFGSLEDSIHNWRNQEDGKGKM